MLYTINGKDFYNSFRLGAREVSTRKDAINAINVFPVKDGDTGTNLMMTMHSIVEETVPQIAFNSVIQDMSEVALENARGNSGLIFASFIGGFSKACSDYEEVTLASFGNGAYHAACEAYEAVATPVEGTMLTVMKEWALYLLNNHTNHSTFKDYLDGAYEVACKALESTPEKLEILRKNKVVDAGAKGFVLFLEGINRFFHEGDSGGDEMPLAENTYDYEAVEHSHDRLNHRYCTEFVLTNPDRDVAPIEPLLLPYGEALVKLQIGHKTKIHIHSNVPEQISAQLVKQGYQILKTKVDDMILQNAVIENQKSKIAIVTDSIADIPEADLNQLQIHQLSSIMIADGSVYLDKITITSGTVGELLNHSASYPSSSQPDVKQVYNKLVWLLQYYDDIVVCSVSKALSGTYSVFEKAIEKLEDHKGRIHLVDTRLNSAAQGLVVMKAAEDALKGTDVKTLLTRMEQSIKKASIYVSLDTFKYAVLSGRVPNSIGKVLVALGAKPIMSLNEKGEGIGFGLAFSRRKIDRKIEKCVSKWMQSDGIEAYAVVHADNEPLANQYAETFEALIGFPPRYVVPISAITTIHAGVGAVAIALIRRGDHDC